MAKMLRQIDDEALERPFNKAQFIRLIKYMGPYKRNVCIALVLMTIATLSSLGSTMLLSRAVDTLDSGAQEMLMYYVGGMVVLAALGALCTRHRIRLMDTAGRKALATLREDLFNHIQGLSFSFFDSRSPGKILVRVINDVNSLNDLFTNGIVNVLIDCFTLILLLLIMLWVNWQLTLLSLCILPVLFIIIFKIKREMRKRWQITRMKTSNMNGYLHESLSGMRVTEAFVREDENLDTFSNVNDDIRKSWMRAIQINNAFWPMLDLTGTIGTILVYYVGISLMGNASAPLELAELLLIIWYLGRFWEPLNTLSNFYNNILSATASMERIFEIMDTPADVQDKPGAYDLPPIKGRVEFDHVNFYYDPENPVLNDVSFVAEPGQTIALVGATGAGKSTIVNLISRFYDVCGGSLKIDGHDIRDVKIDSLRKQMSVMMQDSFIFSGTIMDNIRYGRLDATDEEVIAAAKAVHAHEFIMQMQKGYQTEVNERGSSLSTGQRQLISFARALLNDPKILILDEATSSIDTHIELLIQDALEVLLRGRTSFVIAHRLSTIRNADCIMVMRDGKIAERGNHDELIRIPNGQYKELCDAQYRFLMEDASSAS
ncbi:MAG TPA: ABC transporter ATP-binding protein [Candidatus Fimadaptatus faecigallinarum]|uniref:ABC transporter ATP-binding protein n=1 Tax=Candidatus Fimadaptatus faecigallinarum TaxID=2840814 RepID=A0A9D1LQ64_9FIRM|nr:ABC transporter ATP-binding protein [Candidatus Fimadaptatus faecigallinarum]